MRFLTKIPSPSPDSNSCDRFCPPIDKRMEDKHCMTHRQCYTHRCDTSHTSCVKADAMHLGARMLGISVQIKGGEHDVRLEVCFRNSRGDGSYGVMYYCKVRLILSMLTFICVHPPSFVVFPPSYGNSNGDTVNTVTVTLESPRHLSSREKNEVFRLIPI